MNTFDMKDVGKKGTIVVTGQSKLSLSISICMLQAGYEVLLWAGDADTVKKQFEQQLAVVSTTGAVSVAGEKLQVVSKLEKTDCALAIAITDEKLNDKTSIIAQLEAQLPADAWIGVNTESIALDEIQEGSRNPERIIGLNWVEPAYTTFFLEIIANQKNNSTALEKLVQEAKASWNKDPYVVHDAISVRSRLFCAMAREAFFLIENGYATVQDIDRACRNDAGYYLPFAGNFRYMDLMGTHSYAEVMKKLNADLATGSHPPQMLREIIADGGLGMENNKGFYSYKNGDTSDWERLFTKFSFQIQEIIEKYPFNYDDKQPITDN
ncbi:MAG: 3-hydroxyacyl-CoA dehydrogenase NAD-binding domain-containing protein [Pedobacter sp.]|nr:3-hydroxyacyl-CoA dehydrogenase NAD-binding domain-containing protein [Pedobacter sp.]MDQ8051693.1 3-hydroxyacyl-CoA dehydrogenase NAD-binding domain-containing protein [Pedobacter sp.]